MVSDLLAHNPYVSMNATDESIGEVVRNDKKSRYEFSQDRTKIRAVQGHSVDVDVGLTPILVPEDLPEVIVHGTYRDVWPAIRSQGLNRMNRQHIHFAQSIPSTSSGEQISGISGLRLSAEVYIFIDGQRSLACGIPFYKALNGAILSPGIDGTIKPEFFAKVTDAQLNILD